MNAIESVKECFENGSVIITAIHQGKGMVRVDAKTRFHIPDANNLFSRWVTEKYAEALSMENYGKKLSELITYKY